MKGPPHSNNPVHDAYCKKSKTIISGQSSLSGKPAPYDSKRDLLALPARLGGKRVTNLTTLSDPGYSVSKQVTAHLYNLIQNQSTDYTHAAHTKQFTVPS